MNCMKHVKILIGHHDAFYFLAKSNQYIAYVNEIQNRNWHLPMTYIADFLADFKSKNQGKRIFSIQPKIYFKSETISFVYDTQLNEIHINYVFICGIEVDKENFEDKLSEMINSIAILNNN